MIRYIKRTNLDLEKYDACIENSVQSSVYAFSWYLDIVADNWDALVLNDYEAVMPIPWKKKFFLKYSIQPYFCQQLGVFSRLDFNDNLMKMFLKKIPSSIVYQDLFFNNKVIDSQMTIKKNFTLKLDKEYLDVYNNYRKDRKKGLKKSTKGYLSFQDFNNKKELINLYKKVFGFLKMPEDYYQKIEKIIEYSLKNDLGFIRNVFYNDNLICSGFFLKYNARIYYLFAASSTEGKKHGATTFLLDSVIREYSNTKTILDFEGSTIPSIASFYKSFGSTLTNYFNYKTNAIKRIFL